MADGLPPNPDAGADEPPQQEPANPTEPPQLDAIRVKGPGARGLNKPAILTAAGGGVARVGKGLVAPFGLARVQRGEIGVAHVDFAAHFKDFGCADKHLRNVGDGAGIVGDLSLIHI